MDIKAKLIIGAFLLAAGGIYSAFFMDHPDNEMATVADAFCACDTDTCRSEQLNLAIALEDKFAGKEVDVDVADRWDEAGDQLARCLEEAGFDEEDFDEEDFEEED